MTFAQPLLIPVGGLAIKLPEAIDDERLSNEVGKWNMQPRDLPSLMEYYVHALKLYAILGQVLDRQESKTDTPADPISNVRSILSFNSKIMEWRDNLPPYLRYDSSVPECDPLKGAAILEPVPDTEVVLDFPALTRRLHCRYVLAPLDSSVGSTVKILHGRFLCVRQLILRPALELLFERQQNEKPTPITEPVAMAKLKDSMIFNIAAQCVLSAVDLVEFLASQIQTQTFVCWWYNIHCMFLFYTYLTGDHVDSFVHGRLAHFGEYNLTRKSVHF